MLKHALLFTVIIFIQACSTTPKYIVDTKYLDKAEFDQDVLECEAIAEQVDVSGEAGESALEGAAVGGVIGAISGGDTETAGRGAAIGGALGLLGGVGEAEQQKYDIARKCLQNRGYELLN